MVNLSVGYLQHGSGSSMSTEQVSVKESGWRKGGKCWLAHYEGRWRVVHVQVKRLFIVYNGEQINIKIEGV